MRWDITLKALYIINYHINNYNEEKFEKFILVILKT